ncbi:peptidoglycan recognition protein family protein [Salininema proteolyticum]|uniref:Peptidoglycan recognition family protein n=1 Tax=Salininema proteolyticum TaxID=1607685 RepID=A0ABV8U5Y5_9ACTN
MSGKNEGRLSRRAVLGAGIAAAGAVAGGLTATPVHAKEPTLLYDRQDWGARPPRGTIDIIGPPTAIVVHHAVWPNTMDFSWERAALTSREIQDLHMDDNGWKDAGQQLTISRGGHVMEARDRSFEAIRQGLNVMGAHVGGHNSYTIGIENEGTYTDPDTVVPSGQFGSLAQTCAWLCERYGLDPHQAIAGHRDFNDTICPGEALYRRLPELRDRTARLLAEW